MEVREQFKSRLGFILISAGCAIGIGNVWRFPYVVGNYGGGIFVFFYLIFLITMGVPILSMEFAVGRASKKSTILSYKVLEKPGQKWHIHGYVAWAGNFLLMMFYTTVAGWMLAYLVKFAKGDFAGLDQAAIEGAFDGLLARPAELGMWMVIVVVTGFIVCSVGLQKGVERLTKGMMIGLLGLILVLAVNSLLLPGGMEGVRFYLLPDFGKMKEIGVANVIVAAMNQAFFTLSVGQGSMEIFGSYMDRKHSLMGESLQIAMLDTFVAVVAGLIIFPACFSFGVNPGSGPKLIFITLPNVFREMAGGRIWGTLFFLFMTFAAFSTILAVFENLMACCMEQLGWNRKRTALVNGILMILASLPCVLGFSLLSGFQPLGAGSTVLDLEDYIVSNLLLPGGSLVYLLFCVSRYGWGFKSYQQEANFGAGVKVVNWMRGYFTYVLPVLVAFILIWGLIK